MIGQSDFINNCVLTGFQQFVNLCFCPYSSFLCACGGPCHHHCYIVDVIRNLFTDFYVWVEMFQSYTNRLKIDQIKFAIELCDGYYLKDFILCYFIFNFLIVCKLTIMFNIFTIFCSTLTVLTLYHIMFHVLRCWNHPRLPWIKSKLEDAVNYRIKVWKFWSYWFSILFS